MRVMVISGASFHPLACANRGPATNRRCGRRLDRAQRRAGAFGAFPWATAAGVWADSGGGNGRVGEMRGLAWAPPTLSRASTGKPNAHSSALLGSMRPAAGPTSLINTFLTFAIREPPAVRSSLSRALVLLRTKQIRLLPPSHRYYSATHLSGPPHQPPLRPAVLPLSKFHFTPSAQSGCFAATPWMLVTHKMTSTASRCAIQKPSGAPRPPACTGISRLRAPSILPPRPCPASASGILIGRGFPTAR